MNPFDLQGPEFLGFWLVGWVAVVSGALCLRARVGPRAREPVDDLAAKLHPTEIAFLLGGVNRAVEAAIAGLHHRGYIEHEAGKLRITKKARDAMLQPDGMFRGAILGEDMSRMEAYVLDRLPAGLTELRRDVAPVAVVIRRRLEEHGLVVEDQARATQLLRLPAYAWMAIGATKVGLGFARGQPVFILLALLLAAPLGIMLLAAPRLTAHGRALEHLLQQRFAALEATARAAPQQLDATELTLAYGVFGSAVAPLALMAVLPVEHVATKSGSSCASACGDCSGGGGCGGCGGCS